MAGGYIATPSDDYSVLVAELRQLSRRLSELETPTGTSVNSLVAQVQATLANLVATANAAAAAWVAANSYTKAQTDSLVANPPAGSNVTGNVNASGPIYTPHGRANVVTTSWVAAGINGDGRIAIQPSSIRFKKDVADYSGSVLGLRPVTYVMKEDPNSTPHVGFIAEEVNDVEPMAVVHEDGEPFALKYDAILAALVADVKRLSAEVEMLRGQSQ